MPGIPMPGILDARHPPPCSQGIPMPGGLCSTSPFSVVQAFLCPASLCPVALARLPPPCSQGILMPGILKKTPGVSKDDPDCLIPGCAIPSFSSSALLKPLGS
jgi:hypothetical protein